MLPAEKKQDQEWIIREEAETDWSNGERPENRDLEALLDNGLVLVDKPSGPTSHQVSQWVQDILERDKTGHSGTLDPKVTGVLPVGLNRGTKVLQALTLAGKEYMGAMELGEEVSRDEIEEVAEEFVGTVKQVPPEKSAVKREERERDIYELEILEVKERQVLFRIECEKGFYVRTFCRNFGEELGVSGEMEDLRRTKVGVFDEDQLHYLQDLKDQHKFRKEGKDNSLEDLVLPVEAGVRHLRKIIVKDSAVAAVCHGANLGTQGISKVQKGIEEGEMVALLTLKGELVALANAEIESDDMVEKEGETAVDLKRVFMQKDVYPKAWRKKNG
ncbi:MAG: RNA-guided pseudouridylation complex pseudouridine synthase subunit Cbf5 [Candidatus Nanohaloarchaea archaeon]|nr:RNA-guided pseudouridylation complex pseudouridine synthase subunit Cbf5 [Candidatus Nanohaloarchaea archaeon]